MSSVISTIRTVFAGATGFRQASIAKGSNLDSSKASTGLVSTVNSRTSSALGSKMSAPVSHPRFAGRRISRHTNSKLYSQAAASGLLSAPVFALSGFCLWLVLFSRQICFYNYVNRSPLPQKPSRSSWTANRHYDLSSRVSCIPLLLFELGYLSRVQAERLRNVRKFSDLPTALKAAITRQRQNPLCLVSVTHVSGLHRSISEHQYAPSLYDLKTLLASTQTFLSTPYSSGEAKPAGEFSSPALRALGGVRTVVSQLVTSAKPSTLDTPWTPGFFPLQAVAQKIAYVRSKTELTHTRTSAYTRSFPTNSTNPKLPEYFEDKLKQVLAGTHRGNGDKSDRVPAQFTKNWPIQPSVDRTLNSAHAGLHTIFNGLSFTGPALKEAEMAMGVNRFLDTRGNRTVQNWEADAWNRWNGISTTYRMVSQDVNYFSIAYRLLARYYFALTASQLGAQCVPQTTTGTTVAITGLSARYSTPIPTPAPNPEAPFHAPGVSQALRAGSKQFIDAEGFSEPEILELLSAMVPQDASHMLKLAMVDSFSPPPPAPPADPNAPADAPPPPPPAPKNIQYFLAPTRYTYDNEVDEVFIHYGNHQIPAYHATLAANVHGLPDAASILSVLRFLAMRHNAGGDIDRAIEVFMTRIAMYHSALVPAGLRGNVPADEYIFGDGHYEMHMPYAKTGMAYFDCFFEPNMVTDYLSTFTSMSLENIVHSGSLITHARAVALNWATFAWSMQGRQWTNLPGRETNTYVRNHIDVWLRHYSSELINLWSSCHNSALAFQYGFALSPFTRATESGRIVKWWDDYASAYLANPYHELWMAQLLPAHQLLPYNDDESPSAVSWPDNTPFPINDLLSFRANPQVELARDLPPFTGRTWMADGGVIANAQHYVAVGLHNGYRYDSTAARPINPPVEVARWTQRHAYNLPRSPAIQQPTWMGPVGSPFADFLLPGCLASCSIENNRSYSYGLQLGSSVKAADIAHITNLWFDAARGAGKTSLMINYISPFPERREVEQLQQYSVVVWERNNAYAGMSLMPTDFTSSSLEEFVPKNIPAVQFTRNGVADISDMNTKPRIAKRLQPPRAAVGNVTRRLEEFAQPLVPAKKSLGTTGQLSYDSKYPNDEQELPQDLGTFVTDVAPTGIAAYQLPDVETYSRLHAAEIQNAKAQVVRLQQRIDEAEQLQYDPAAHTIKREPVYAGPTTNLRYSKAPARPKQRGTWMHTTDHATGKPIRFFADEPEPEVNIATVRGIDPQQQITPTPVETNDQVAVDVQAAMLDIARPARKVAGSRLADKNPKPTPFFAPHDPFKGLTDSIAATPPIAAAPPAFHAPRPRSAPPPGVTATPPQPDAAWKPDAADSDSLGAARTDGAVASGLAEN